MNHGRGSPAKGKMCGASMIAGPPLLALLAEALCNPYNLRQTPAISITTL